ncbi:MAG: hypothetical protein CFE41_01095 [Burkholderiales bacterium PBB2]|nr:MAG: hypothetical protein CFE41_01095 [Burkholderiales bacterium PBB2]
MLEAIQQAAAVEDGSVNPHYLDHLVATAETRDIEATEDILSGSGVKLLARGSKISAAQRERLLQHKLQKPLEHCLGLSEGISPQRLAEVAHALLERYPLLAGLCSHARARPAAESLAHLPLSPPLQALLAIYAQRGSDRLEHAVGVALAALGLGRRLMPGDLEAHRLLKLAGLLHDVGELYLQPDYLRRDLPLHAEQWRHLVSHPIISHRVLHGIEGGGPALAALVISHHERLDGFGYPQGLRGEAELGLPAQILAAAEWLVGLMESGASAVVHASIATKLIPGEFSDQLLEELRQVSAASAGPHGLPNEAASLADALPKAVRVAIVLRSFRHSREQIEARLADASPALCSMLELFLHRLQQLQTSFTSAGLDTGQPEQVFDELVAEAGAVKVEVVSLVREFSWRMRELERESLMRASQLSSEDQALLQGLIDTLKADLSPSS